LIVWSLAQSRGDGHRPLVTLERVLSEYNEDLIFLFFFEIRTATDCFTQVISRFNSSFPSLRDNSLGINTSLVFKRLSKFQNKAVKLIGGEVLMRVHLLTSPN